MEHARLQVLNKKLKRLPSSKIYFQGQLFSFLAWLGVPLIIVPKTNTTHSARYGNPL